MSGDRGWAAALRSACEHPEAAAAVWRAGGGQVAGLLGWSAPRELVTAAGMLPVRLSPERLAGLGLSRGSEGRNEQGAAEVPVSAGGHALPDAPAAFGHELAPATAALAAALLSGALDWIDFLVIGRDREDYTRLFYLLRELRRGGAAPGLIPVAFFDLLRLPSRTSARYNRQRAAGLVAVIAGWAGHPVTPADLVGAVAAAGETAHSFRGIQELRSRPQPGISGTDALAAAIADRVRTAARARLPCRVRRRRPRRLPGARGPGTRDRRRGPRMGRRRQRVSAGDPRPAGRDRRPLPLRARRRRQVRAARPGRAHGRPDPHGRRGLRAVPARRARRSGRLGTARVARAPRSRHSADSGAPA